MIFSRSAFKPVKNIDGYHDLESKYKLDIAVRYWFENTDEFWYGNGDTSNSWLDRWKEFRIQKTVAISIQVLLEVSHIGSAGEAVDYKTETQDASNICK